VATRDLRASAGGDAFVVKVTGHTVDVQRGAGGAVVRAETQYLGHGRLVLRVDGVSHVAWVVEDGDTRWVHCDGDVVQVEIEERSSRRPRSRDAEGPAALVAPMPATVVRVVATPGTHVQKGAVILLLEAMKMELPLRAPHDGVVKTVRCREGELVQPNVALVEMEPEGEPRALGTDAG
jgi:3-methylcrotonyl-CoA carboxylase alpha subunit